MVGIAGEADVSVEALPNGFGADERLIHGLRHIEVLIDPACVESDGQRGAGRLIGDGGNAGRDSGWFSMSRLVGRRGRTCVAQAQGSGLRWVGAFRTEREPGCRDGIEPLEA